MNYLIAALILAVGMGAVASFLCTVAEALMPKHMRKGLLHTVRTSFAFGAGIGLAAFIAGTVARWTIYYAFGV